MLRAKQNQVRRMTEHNKDFPVKYKQSKIDIDGVETEILCMVFGDVINITITQLNKIGCLVRTAFFVNLTNQTKKQNTNNFQ